MSGNATYGFVLFYDLLSAVSAKQFMDGENIRGNNIRVSQCRMTLHMYICSLGSRGFHVLYMLMRSGIASCLVGGCLTSRCEGCLWPRDIVNNELDYGLTFTSIHVCKLFSTDP